MPFLVAEFLCAAADDWLRGGKRAMCVGARLDVGGFKFRCFNAVSELYACDWIYAASFATHSNSVYLAGYSGRVVLVNQAGEALRVYDLDDVPRRIVDTGEYLYILTRSRLYVVRDDSVYARIDRLDGGDLLVAKGGFGLLAKNCLRWFDQEGALLGSIPSKDPIRRVYCAADVMVMETRQRRASSAGRRHGELETTNTLSRTFLARATPARRAS